METTSDLTWYSGREMETHTHTHTHTHTPPGDRSYASLMPSHLINTPTPPAKSPTKSPKTPGQINPSYTVPASNSKIVNFIIQIIIPIVIVTPFTIDHRAI